MFHHNSTKAPLIMTWIANDDPRRGDCQMAIGLGSLLSDILNGTYLYVDREMLESHFPEASNYAQMRIMALKKFGSPQILLGTSEAERIYDRIPVNEKPLITVTGWGENISKEFNKNGLVPHNLNHVNWEQEKKQFKSSYPNISGPLVAVMVASEMENSGDTINALFNVALKHKDITFFFCPNRRSQSEANKLAHILEKKLSQTEVDAGQRLVINESYKNIQTEYNPYKGLLACADHLVVSGSSYSTVSDALFMGKTVYVNSDYQRYGQLIDSSHLVTIEDLESVKGFTTLQTPCLDVSKEIALKMANFYKNNLQVKF